MTKPNGGQAFPRPGCEGMSLRDFFAAAALAGISAADIHDKIDATTLSWWAYDVADAMLAERERKERGCDA